MTETLEPLPPLSLYVHFPWCVRKCPYCDFNSHTLQGELPEAQYLGALTRDLHAQLPSVPDRPLGSVFFGGGTPSLIDPEALGRWLDATRLAVPFAPDAEITLEANPGTIEHGRFADYRAAGINRVSLGAQSFDPAQLERLGRIHAAGDIARAVHELRDAGLDNFNLDLMYALPGQTLAAALDDLRQAIALAPAHLSHYQLTLEPGTVFGGRPPAGLPDADASFEMQLACQSLLAEHGYPQYEVSAYAQPGRRSRHNLNYWRFGDYLGLGAGAHGKVSRRRDDALVISRSTRVREPRRYLAALAQDVDADWREVPAADLPFEFALNAMRLTEGFAPADYERATGLPVSDLEAPLARARQRGLATWADGRWLATERGYAFLNDLLAEFLPIPSDIQRT